MRPKKSWDEFCFRCFEEGTLLQCDVKACSKTYHLSCVNQEKTPREKWFCPWHHCVTCGKTASKSCVHCTNAYCKTHDGELKLHPLLGLTCKEHKDDLPDLVKFYAKIETTQNTEKKSDEPVQVLKGTFNLDCFHTFLARRRQLEMKFSGFRATDVQCLISFVLA